MREITLLSAVGSLLRTPSLFRQQHGSDFTFDKAARPFAFLCDQLQLVSVGRIVLRDPPSQFPGYQRQQFLISQGLAMTYEIPYQLDLNASGCEASGRRLAETLDDPILLTDALEFFRSSHIM